MTFSKLPSGHGKHISLPLKAAKVPGEQDLHCEPEVEPVALAKVPGEQEIHVELPLAPACLPVGHDAHVSLPSAAAKVPGEQDLHCEAEVEPVASAKVPGEQDVQLTPPATSW